MENHEVVTGTASPVVHDGYVSLEKVLELLAIGAEQFDLDWKVTVDPRSKRDRVELAKDIGAMQVRGGYILIGVNDRGEIVGLPEDVETEHFDEARLRPRLSKWLPATVQITTAAHRVDDNQIVVLYTPPNRTGCAVMLSDGQYAEETERTAFRAGDVFWRNGTRSEPITPEGFEQIVGQRVAREKTSWIVEQQQIREADRVDLESQIRGFRAADSSLAALTFDLPRRELELAALELVRAEDDVGLMHLLRSGEHIGRKLVNSSPNAPELDDLLDKFVTLAAAFIEFRSSGAFVSTLQRLDRVYASPMKPGDIERFGHSTSIPNNETAPRLWLKIVQRIYALGALLVEEEAWSAVAQVVERDPVPGFDQNWLRQTVTMASRASLFRDTGPEELNVSLLSLARRDGDRLAWFESPGLQADDSSLTALCVFDLLAAFVSISNRRVSRRRSFYPNFARFDQGRVNPTATRLVEDLQFRAHFFTGANSDFALALAEVEKVAAQEGMRFSGFMAWPPSVTEFVELHLPEEDVS